MLKDIKKNSTFFTFLDINVITSKNEKFVITFKILNKKKNILQLIIQSLDCFFFSRRLFKFRCDRKKKIVNWPRANKSLKIAQCEQISLTGKMQTNLIKK